MFEDGSYLDLVKNTTAEVLPRTAYGCAIHNDVDYFIRDHIPEGVDHTKAYPYMDSLVMFHNCVKLQDAVVIECEHPYIMLPKEEINVKQYENLLDWIYDLYKKPKKFVYIAFGSRMKRYFVELVTPENQNGCTPEDIIKEIKKIYSIAANSGWITAIEELNKFTRR